ncbi:MAG: hypothetical protein CMK56_07255, partial [Proteobacteria bacterium]|nr:hypothetical protein [Pseudomonadota bacterium]
SALSRFYTQGLVGEIDLIEAYAWVAAAESKFSAQEVEEIQEARRQKVFLSEKMNESQRNLARLRFDEVMKSLEPAEELKERAGGSKI